MALSVFSWPYGFYVLFKFIVTGTAAYCAWYWHNTKKEYDLVFWLAVAVAVLFNPIAPIYLYSKEVWFAIDVLTAGYFLYFIKSLK